MSRVRLSLRVERVPFNAPLRITGYTFTHAETVVVELAADGCIGQGEASGVYYHGETPQSMAGQIEHVRAAIEDGMDRAGLQGLLPAGGARNAVDCAMWALDSQRRGQPIWELAGLARPGPVTSTATISAGTADEMAAASAALGPAQRIKLKLLGDGHDAARLHAVRKAQPAAWLMVDANQGFDREGYLALLPAMQACGVRLVEQPFPLGQEAWLDGLPRPIAIAADESFLTSADLPGLMGRFDVASIKLDKCGGFTEALAIAAQARSLNLGLMVGCMVTGSLGMAPAYLIAALCDVADIDGPLYITEDRRPALRYEQGSVTMPAGVWGL
jgi:L-alanine-DL-glutamate epimerase-like enolase superfamily enzyme